MSLLKGECRQLLQESKAHYAKSLNHFDESRQQNIQMIKIIETHEQSRTERLLELIHEKTKADVVATRFTILVVTATGFIAYFGFGVSPLAPAAVAIPIAGVIGKGFYKQLSYCYDGLVNKLTWCNTRICGKKSSPDKVSKVNTMGLSQDLSLDSQGVSRSTAISNNDVILSVDSKAPTKESHSNDCEMLVDKLNNLNLQQNNGSKSASPVGLNADQLLVDDNHINIFLNSFQPQSLQSPKSPSQDLIQQSSPSKAASSVSPIAKPSTPTVRKQSVNASVTGIVSATARSSISQIELAAPVSAPVSSKSKSTTANQPSVAIASNQFNHPSVDSTVVLGSPKPIQGATATRKSSMIRGQKR